MQFNELKKQLEKLSEFSGTKLVKYKDDSREYVQLQTFKGVTISDFILINQTGDNLTASSYRNPKMSEFEIIEKIREMKNEIQKKSNRVSLQPS